MLCVMVPQSNSSQSNNGEEKFRFVQMKTQQMGHEKFHLSFDFSALLFLLSTDQMNEYITEFIQFNPILNRKLFA